jgi:hypothetical protein
MYCYAEDSLNVPDPDTEPRLSALEAAVKYHSEKRIKERHSAAAAGMLVASDIVSGAAPVALKPELRLRLDKAETPLIVSGIVNLDPKSLVFTDHVGKVDDHEEDEKGLVWISLILDKTVLRPVRLRIFRGKRQARGYYKNHSCTGNAMTTTAAHAVVTKIPAYAGA